jgi:integrase
MSVVKRSNSRFWYIHFQMNGKTFIKSSKTMDHKIAERMEVEWRAQLHRQFTLGEPERITLTEAVSLFLRSRAGTPNHRGLFHCSKTILRRLSYRKYLDELTNTDLERYQQDRLRDGLSPQTIYHQFSVVRGAVKTAKRLGFKVPSLDYPSVKIPKHKVRYLTLEEEGRLLAELDPNREQFGLLPLGVRPEKSKRQLQDCYDLVVCLLDTGARYSEIADIRWDQIDMDQGLIGLWRSKVSNEGVIAMTKRVRAVFTRRYQERGGDFVLTNSEGGKRGYAPQSIRKAMKRAGLHDCTIHTLRHTHASRLIQNGLSVYEVRAVLGHTDIKTTMRYAHLEQVSVTQKARDVINRLNSP